MEFISLQILYQNNISSQVLDAGDLAVMPGVVDSHVHVNEPGRTDWEGFVTATQAAASGGITTIVDMPLYVLTLTHSNTHCVAPENPHVLIRESRISRYFLELHNPVSWFQCGFKQKKAFMGILGMDIF